MHRREDSKYSGHAHFPFFGCDMSGIMKGVSRMMDKYIGKFDGWFPYDLEEREDDYLILVPLPGLSKEDVKISLIENNLNISTKKVEKTDEKSNQKSQNSNQMHCEPHSHTHRGFLRFFLNNLWQNGINMDIPLPSNANENSIKPKMTNGLLKIRIAKKTPRKVDINVEDNNQSNI
ncbi:MAG: Hsp20 family protein [Candidatus Lokiarchaeota archaeon]|nr:Hsp20 family protein [Candidatus Lokiarchaeota archaeon]